MESYSMVVKKRSRTFFRKFILKVKKFKRYPDKVRVLCFPGKEGLEIFEVYDRIGVKRSNIVCLERDKKTYDDST